MLFLVRAFSIRSWTGTDNPEGGKRARRRQRPATEMSFKGALDTIVANTARYFRRQKHARVIRKI